ncbi:MAG: alpha/beta hydrolase [Cyanothece sp. SIO1E1]|nr:alpha/beta hydrolase [Cyanothece sp. SIO1E1]
MSLQAIAIPPTTNTPATGLFVGLHGWGANAQDLASLAPLMNLPDCQLLFPDAPFPHPHAPGGKMWYGFPEGYNFLSQPDFRHQQDLAESRQRLQDWLLSLESTLGIPLSRTILAGFSQGGAMTMDVGLQLPLAGLMVLSGYAHAPILTAAPYTSPLFMVHGKQDPVVPLLAAHQARDDLSTQGAQVQYHELDMGHEIQPMALALMRSFILEVLSKVS